ARAFNKEIRAEDPSLEIILVELYIDNPDWFPSSERARWRGCGALIVTPQHTTGDRIKATLNVMCQELMKSRPADSPVPMHVIVEHLK
ncbi:unnamed protein product, partial [Polarella glacialis]